MPVTPQQSVLLLACVCVWLLFVCCLFVCFCCCFRHFGLKQIIEQCESYNSVVVVKQECAHVEIDIGIQGKTGERGGMGFDPQQV